MKSRALPRTSQHSGWSIRTQSYALLGLLGLACGGAPSPCASFGGCPSSQECLANTCVPRGGQPVEPSSQRQALEPTRWHVVSSSQVDDQQQQPAVHFGGGGARESLLLDYDLPAISPKQLERAFLLMSPLPDAPQGAQPATVSAWRVIEAWTRPRVAPLATRPSSQGIASAPLPLRIDVTNLVQRWLANRSSSFGVLLKSSSTEGHPQVFATGVGGGHSPVLELYYTAAAPAAPSSRAAR